MNRNIGKNVMKAGWILLFIMCINLLSTHDVKADNVLPVNGTWVQGNINDNSDSDAYYFEISDTGTVTIKLMGFYKGAYMSLYNEDYSKSYYSYSYAAGTNTSPKTTTEELVLRKGRYRLKIASGMGDYGDYRISVNFSAYNVNETEPNDFNHATNLTFGKLIIGAIDEDDDADWYKIDVAKKTKIEIVLTGYFYVAHMHLYNDDLSVTYFSYKSAGGWSGPVSNKQEVELAAGIYYLKIDSGTGVCGKYTLKVSQFKDNTAMTSERPIQATIIKAKNLKGKKVRIEWKRIENVSGYQIAYAKNKKFVGQKKAAAKGENVTRKTIRKLKKGKTYYFRIRAYQIVEGKKVYGKYSKVKRVKVKK